jgi:hypothetical protein
VYSSLFFSHQPKDRPTAREVLDLLECPKNEFPEISLFSNVSNVDIPENHSVRDIIEALGHNDAYYFWRLSSNGLNRLVSQND